MKLWHKFQTTYLPSGGSFDPESLKKQITELTEKTNNPDLWSNPDEAKKLLQKKSSLEKSLRDLEKLESDYTTLSELYEIDSDDQEVLQAIEKLGEETNIEVSIPPMKYCTDNATMIAAAGYYAYLDGRKADLTLNSTSSAVLK